MSTQLITEKSFNELVFENKNKSYGAYSLRRDHGNTVAKSMMITLGAITLLISFILFNKPEDIKKLSIDANISPLICDWHEIVLPKPEKPAEPVQKKEPVLPEKTDAVNFKADDTKQDPDIKPVDLMNVGAKKVDSGSVNHDPGPIEPVIVGKAVSNKEEIIVTEMPEFQGDLYKFMRDHIRYPEFARTNGTEGTVGLSFVIEKDGSIGDIKVLGRVADGCTEEAIRVVKLMPNWKPGKNHGELVRVRYNLPVKFKLK
jgi:protein TonB